MAAATYETWSAVLRRLVRQEEAQEREKLARRRVEALRSAPHLSSGAASGGQGESGGGHDKAATVDGSDKSAGSEASEPAAVDLSACNAPRDQERGDGKEKEKEGEEEEEEGDRDFLQKHLLSREDAHWVCLEDAQQSNCVALNRRGTLLAVGERDGRVSVWDNVSLRVITRELDPTSIAVPDEFSADSEPDAGNKLGDGRADADAGDTDEQRAAGEPRENGRTAVGEDEGEAEAERNERDEGNGEEDEDADANEYSTGNDDASVEADDDETASVEEGDASTEEEEDPREPRELSAVADGEDAEDRAAGLSMADLRRARSSLKVVTQCAWSCDSRWLLAACEEKATRQGVLCVWDVDASTLVAAHGFAAVVNCISVHPRDPALAVVCAHNAAPVLLNLSTRRRRRLSAVPLENPSLTISVPSTSRHPSLMVAARYGASGEFIYAATSRATVAVLDAATLACVHKVGLNVLIQYLDLAVSGTETALLLTSAKGIHEFRIVRAANGGSEGGGRGGGEGEEEEGGSGGGEGSERVRLEEKWLLSTGAVRAPWALCGFTGDEKFAIGVPVVRHRHVGENGLYTWDRSTGRVQHNVGVKDGVTALTWDAHRGGLVAASATGALYVFEEAFTTVWPGSMYPAGFRLLTDNEPHHAAFDAEDARERARADADLERALREKEPIDLFAATGSADAGADIGRSGADAGVATAIAAEAAAGTTTTGLVLPPVENELLCLPAIPIVQQPVKRHGHVFQGGDYHEEKHFGLGQSVFEPLKAAPLKKTRSSGSSKKRKSGRMQVGAPGSASKSKSSKRSGGSGQKRRRR